MSCAAITSVCAHVRVIRRFNDKATGQRYEVGDTYEGERSVGLIAKGRIEQVRAPMGRLTPTAESEEACEPDD